MHQRCHHLIHLELPFNPNRMEQRNGRIDRYGQTRRPVVRYLYLRASFGERILLRLGQFLKVQVREQGPVDVRQLFQVVTEAVGSKLESRKVSLKTEVEDGLAAILCDPLHVGEALRNLVDNALDALSPGGRITLGARREADDWAMVWVQDNGAGIPSSVKNKIFEAFVSTKQQGMGLGLPYVKRVVDACGGRIEVESEEGKGTTFRVLLPE